MQIPGTETIEWSSTEQIVTDVILLGSYPDNAPVTLRDKFRIENYEIRIPGVQPIIFWGGEPARSLQTEIDGRRIHRHHLAGVEIPVKERGPLKSSLVIFLHFSPKGEKAEMLLGQNKKIIHQARHRTEQGTYHSLAAWLNPATDVIAVKFERGGELAVDVHYLRENTPSVGRQRPNFIGMLKITANLILSPIVLARS